jgi:hypothetical protein
VEREPGRVIPGASAFRKREDGAIERVGRAAEFGPGDDYCPVWHLLDLVEGGAGSWEPKYAYRHA